MATERHRDRKLVELFIKTYKHGQYAGDVHWKNHSRYKDVELIAKDASGKLLAVEHTILENFPDVWRKEDFFKRATKSLQDDVTLRVPGRVIWLYIPAEAFDTANPWRWDHVDQALILWAKTSLSTLPVGCSEHAIPITSSQFKFKALVIEHSDNPGAVIVKGLLPIGVIPSLEKVHNNKVPKLLRSESHKRILLIELHGKMMGMPDFPLKVAALRYLTLRRLSLTSNFLSGRLQSFQYSE